MGVLETTYSHILNTIFGIANPIKKTIIKTECEVHKSINLDAINILKNDNYSDEFNLFYSYLLDINKGAVWADQDFKSSNHFYNPQKGKMDGLYGRKSAMELGIDYYIKSRKEWNTGNFNDSMFYLGAALHIIQDMTIPQHANTRLLDNHRQFETFVKRTYKYADEFKVDRGTYLLHSIENYISFNTRTAIKIYKKFKMISDDELRYFRIAKCTLPLAKRTTAGAMVMFYKDILL